MTDKGSIERFRLFVAITVPDTVREEMIRVQSELRPLAPPNAVRWARPEQFHLTLRFLGDVASDHVAGLQESVRTVCTRVPILRLHARGIGFFPHARSPRVVWIGVSDDENRLAEVQKKIEGAVRPFTTERGNEHFAGHVTLGRFNQFKRLEIRELIEHAEAMKDRPFGEWTAPEIEIIRSELLPAGARYTSLAALPLNAKLEPF